MRARTRSLRRKLLGTVLLTTLATLQATEIDAVADSAPGKILHEMRGGEMAGLGEACHDIENLLAGRWVISSGFEKSM